MSINKIHIVRADDHKSMHIDLDSDKYLARLTVWARGEHIGLCDAEVLDVNTEQTVFWKHDEFDSDQKLQDIIQGFWGALGTLDHTSQFTLDLIGNQIRTSSLLEPLMAA